MNIHHLELFYEVALHGGVTAAAKNGRARREQSTISAQVNALEADLGITLFDRKPFKLTFPGQRLYAAIRPFFSSLEAIERDVRGEGDNFVRIGSSAVILRKHLQPLLSRVKQQIPKFRFTLENVLADDVPESVHARRIDIGIGPKVKAPKGVNSELIASVPLGLLVHKRSRWRSAEDFLKSDPNEEHLIALRSPEILRDHFDRELFKKMRVRYPASTEVTAIYLVAEYVQAEFGVGLYVQVEPTPPDGTRFLPLHKIAPLEYYVYWREPTSKNRELPKAEEALLDEIRAASKKLKLPPRERK